MENKEEARFSRSARQAEHSRPSSWLWLALPTGALAYATVDACIPVTPQPCPTLQCCCIQP